MAPKNTYKVTNGPNKMDLMLGLFDPNLFDYERLVEFTYKTEGGSFLLNVAIRSVEAVAGEYETWNILALEEAALADCDGKPRNVITITGYSTRSRTGLATGIKHS